MLAFVHNAQCFRRAFGVGRDYTALLPWVLCVARNLSMKRRTLVESIDRRTRLRIVACPVCSLLGSKAKRPTRVRLLSLVLATVTTVLGGPVPSRQASMKIERTDIDIRLNIQFYDDVHQPPEFYGRSLRGITCFSMDGQPCAGAGQKSRAWIGAFAIVHYYVVAKRPGTSLSRLRERVRVIDHSEGMADRAEFQESIDFVDGVGSDIQLFGSEELRFMNRKSPVCDSGDCLWSLVRQEIFYGDQLEPVLIIHWLHTLNEIKLIDVIPLGKSSITTKGRD